MTKKGFLGAAAILSAATVAAIASATPTQAPEGRAERRAGRRGVALADVLGLTDQQKADWNALHEQQREQMKPVMEEGSALRKKLREAVEAASPDPRMVGEATLALEAHRQKARAQREAFRQKLEGLLDPAQKEKLKAFEAGRRAGVGRDGRRGPRVPGHQRRAAPIEG